MVHPVVHRRAWTLRGSATAVPPWVTAEGQRCTLPYVNWSKEAKLTKTCKPVPETWGVRRPAATPYTVVHWSKGEIPASFRTNGRKDSLTRQGAVTVDGLVQLGHWLESSHPGHSVQFGTLLVKPLINAAGRVRNGPGMPARTDRTVLIMVNNGLNRVVPT